MLFNPRRINKTSLLCSSLFTSTLIVGISFFHSPVHAQDTVPKLTGQDGYCALYDGYSCTGKYGNILSSSSEARQWIISQNKRHPVTGGSCESWSDGGVVYGIYRRLICTYNNGQNTSTGWRYAMSPTHSGQSFCPSTHPIDNGDGTCSMNEQDLTCWRQHNLYTQAVESNDPSYAGYEKFLIATPNKYGNVCVPLWDGLDVDDPNQKFCSYTVKGDVISLGGGEVSGTFKPNAVSCNPAPEPNDPPLDEPETPEECERRGYATCAADGMFLVSADIVEGFCIPVCSETMPDPEPPEQSDVDDDQNGIPDVNDPNHPNYDPDDPHSDADGDGNPNYEDPTHPTYIGGGGTVANTEGTNVLLKQILDTNVVSNDLTVTTNDLIAQQTKMLNEKLNAVASGGYGGGGVGGGADWTDETGGVDLEDIGCTPDPITGACQEFGSIGVQSLPSEVINVGQYADDFDPIDTTATCPESVDVGLGFTGDFNFNTGPMCEILSGVYYLVMFGAYFMVARIITRGVAG